MTAPAAPNSPPEDVDREAPSATAVADGAGPGGPPEEEFWEAYNKRHEFPLSAVGTVVLHVLVGAVLVVLIAGLMDNTEDRSAPELKLLPVGGLDEQGQGSPGSGGTPDPEFVRETDAGGVRDSFPTPEALQKARQDLRLLLEDPNAQNLPIAPSNLGAYLKLNQALKEKLLGVQQGEGKEPGRSSDGTQGNGTGGTGPDSTRARGLRWVLRFSVRGGSDYIAQLRSMGAEILIPLSSDKDCIIVPDLGAPRSARTATDADLKRLAGKIQFSDQRPAMVKEVVGALGVKVSSQPNAFWAFFPKDVEDKLARLEKGHRNRLPENIEETIFRVTIRDGRYEVAVEHQAAKK
jgi:hypothetical protein